MLSRKIHDLSPRQNKLIITVNLASISPSLFERELFGHKKGTFIGAGNDKMGYFEAAPILGVSERTLQRRLKIIRDKTI